MLLASGELVRTFVGLGLHAYLLQHLAHVICHQLLVFPSGRAEDEQEVLLYRTVGEQFIILKDDAQTATEVRQFAAADGTHVVVQHLRLAADDRQRAVERLHQRGLAATDFALEINHLPALNGQVHVVQDDLIRLMDLNIFIFD